MKQNVIREFKLWSICMAVGFTVLLTEAVVKARKPVEPATPVQAQNASYPVAPVLTEIQDEEIIPEELVANLLVESIVQVESAGRPRMVGKKGERGLMQIKEGTWRDTTRRLFGRLLPFDRAFDATLNRQVGAAYLAYLHQFIQANRDQWQSDERSLLLACYNAGPQRVASARFDLLRLPASTRDYVQRASALHDLYLSEHAMRLEPASHHGGMQIVQVRGNQES